MNRFCLTGILLLGMLVPAVAQQKRLADIPAVKRVLAKQQEAWNSGHIDEFMEYYWQSDSLRFIGKSGVTYGWKNTLNNYKKNYPDKDAMGELQFELLSVELLDKTHAFVVGKWELKRSKDNPKGHFTLLFRKIKGQWLIVCDHTS